MREVNKKQLIALAILAGLNILFSNLVDTGGRELSGKGIAAHSPEMRRALFSTFLFGIQLISFLMGAVVAAIPFRKKAYDEKVITFSLGIAIGLQSLFLLGAVGKLLFWM